LDSISWFYYYHRRHGEATINEGMLAQHQFLKMYGLKFDKSFLGPHEHEMPVQNETLYELCKQTLTKTLDYIRESISKGEKYTESLKLKPIIEADQVRGLMVIYVAIIWIAFLNLFSKLISKGIRKVF
jgi:hypothetical protein